MWSSFFQGSRRYINYLVNYLLFSRVVIIRKPAPTLSDFYIPLHKVDDDPFTLVAPTSNSTGSFTYTSSDTSVATNSAKSQASCAVFKWGKWI